MGAPRRPSPAGRRPAQGTRLPALEARRTSSVARITRAGRAVLAARWCRPAGGPSPRPISSIGWRTLVRAGRVAASRSASRRSRRRRRPRGPGDRRPASTPSAPAAIRSEAANTGVDVRARPRAAAPWRAAPPSWVKSPTRDRGRRRRRRRPRRSRRDSRRAGRRRRPCPRGRRSWRCAARPCVDEMRDRAPRAAAVVDVDVARPPAPPRRPADDDHRDAARSASGRAGGRRRGG